MIKIALLTLLVLLNSVAIANDNQKFNTILEGIKQLESKSDPKCYATASRLEDFIYGTALSDLARFYKNDWQKQAAKILWQNTQRIQKKNPDIAFNSALQQVLKPIVTMVQQQNGDWLLQFSQSPEQKQLILARDIKHYSSIAYSLRAILAAQQDSLFDQQSLDPLSSSQIQTLKQSLDLLTMTLIKQADQQVRMADRYSIDVADLNQAKNQLGLDFGPIQSTSDTPAPPIETAVSPKAKKLLLSDIIKQKINSYKNYNDISNQLFVRNMQVYFARLSWPESAEEAKLLKHNFINAVTEFSAQLYLSSMTQAQKSKHSVIKEADVNTSAQHLLPHLINDYEDAIFYPKLDKDQQISIEAYDMDSFRDSGLHWKYLQFALDNITQTQAQNKLLDVDPFAAELLTENIAQYAVLLLRSAGHIGTKANQERLTAQAIPAAQQHIKEQVLLNNTSDLQTAKPQLLASSDLQVKNNSYFNDVTQQSKIDLMHRSSDWLNRLLRSYLRKDKTTGIITIPPAFGGSGVATEDINNDGFADVLLLSGLGNKLYLNDGKGQFIDITDSAGLAWKRPEDNHPGEPRQPIISDMNNDGWQDIIITYVNDNTRIYKNLGNGRFKDMTNISQLAGKNSVAGPATVFDYDNDGLLDIYVSYFGDYLKGVLPTLKRRNHNGLANKLYKNTGDFSFKDVTQSAGVADTGWGQALTHTDLNNDNWQDLIVGNDFGINVYYINNKNGTFTDMAKKLGTDKPSYTMNTSVADLNRDQLPDIYISNIVTMNKDEKYVLPNEQTNMKFNADKLANMRVVEANDLFLSHINAEGKLRYQASDVVGRGYSSTGWSWDADFFDADLDGDDDLYVVNGMNEFNLYSSKNPYYTDPDDNERKNILMPVSTKESNVFFLNQGGKLKNISHQSGLDLLGNSRSAAYFDYDNDGDLDVILNNYHAKAVMYQNDANRLKNHWLKVRALGDPEKKVNRDAIGARIVVTSNKNHQVWREIHGSTGYLSAHPKTQHFGLGQADKANIKIIWPNGQIQAIDNIPVNQYYIIDQKKNSISVYNPK